MNFQTYIFYNILLLFTSCRDKGFDVPMGTPDSNNNQESNTFACPDLWSNLGGVWLDPNLCVAWSDKSELLTLEESQNYCAQLTEGELSGWRLPSLDELSHLAMNHNPIEDIFGDLWTSSEDPVSGLYWTINLDQPGMEVLLEANDQANVRCITELQ